MIKNILGFFNTTYNTFNDYGFDNLDPQLIRYFRTEFGKEWKNALNEHLLKERSKNDKKAA
tara:strand:- start:404 stop:586 length:183 start_codon:yes stop_codon:yes gene_type:complete